MLRNVNFLLVFVGRVSTAEFIDFVQILNETMTSTKGMAMAPEAVMKGR